MERYARIIQESQYDLGLEVSSFDNIGMSASSFLWQIVQKDDNNNQEQEVSNENYQTDRQYEQDSLTSIAKILEIIMIMLIGFYG
jgi:C4-dicarboxylate transporter